MNRPSPLNMLCLLSTLLLLAVMPACKQGGGTHEVDEHTDPDRGQQQKLAIDREAILGMAGTFKVTFDFQEVYSPREGYELHKPYGVSAEELVVVAEDRGDYIVLQHLLVLRHEGKSHIIHHWRQDWQYMGGSGYAYNGQGAWEPMPMTPSHHLPGTWLQTVYNVDDSPRYANRGKWVHDDGVSTWVGAGTRRPLPLREGHLSERYDYLDAINTHVVDQAGWSHKQINRKIDADHPTQPVLAFEQGLNRYMRVPDENFDDAHAYWKNTEPFWEAVRGVWSEVFARNEPITLQDKWKGESMYSHLSGLADEYWGQADTSGAVPRIEEVIEAFLAREGDE